jgi:class 3 adenylate cyclase/pimeloyl-ACP methyl ester carboxylesterase
MEQDIRFCKTADGVRIAYAVSGSGPPLVRSLGWFTHLEYEWETPYWRNINEGLASRFTLVRYDGRGMGLSDLNVTDFSFAAKVGDLEAVVDAAGIDACAMLGISEGGPTATAYTARHPQKVTHLVLYGTTPSFRNMAPTENAVPLDVILTLVRQGWGSDIPSSRQFFTGMFMPDAQGEAVRLFTEFQRRSAPAENVAAMMTALMEYDVTDLAPQIRRPTLVIHRRGDTAVRFDGGREFAALIPGARLAPLDGRNHVPMPEEPETAQLMRLVEEFILGSDDLDAPASSSPARQSALVTILFTDLVGHTEMMSRLGDERGRTVLREHEEITRNVLKQHGGTEVKTMGDGFMASFASVTRAVECAIALQRAFDQRNNGLGAVDATPVEPLHVRVGLNAGEPIEEDGDLFGATVIMASRIAAKADAGEILVADTVRGLCSGKGFLFADRGEFVAKGFEDAVRLYEVRWRD